MNAGTLHTQVQWV